MANLALEKQKNITAFRKIALGTWQTAYDPSIYGTMRLRMDRALAYIEKFREKTGKKLTVTHLVSKAVASALQACPDANAILRWNRIYLRKQVNLSVLVLIQKDDRVDLSAVKLQDADQMSLESMVDVIEGQVQKIRERKDKALEQTRQSMKKVPFVLINFLFKLLSFFAYTLNWNMARFGIPKDAFGGAMVTSIGSIGLDVGYVPIVPYSRVPIYVAPGEIQAEPVVQDGQIVIGHIMNLNATFDHRIVDGGHAAKLAKTVRTVLEDPFQYLDPVE